MSFLWWHILCIFFCTAWLNKLKIAEAFLLVFGLMTPLSVPLVMSHVTNHLLSPDECRNKASTGEWLSTPFCPKVSGRISGHRRGWGLPPFANTITHLHTILIIIAGVAGKEKQWFLSFRFYLTFFFVINKIPEVLCFLDLFQKQWTRKITFKVVTAYLLSLDSKWYIIKVHFSDRWKGLKLWVKDIKTHT